MAGRKSIWTEEMQNYLEANVSVQDIASIATHLEISTAVVHRHRSILLKKMGVTYLKINRGKPVELNKKKLGFERPAANYSNRSPYGIAIPGLKNLQQ